MTIGTNWTMTFLMWNDFSYDYSCRTHFLEGYVCCIEYSCGCHHKCNRDVIFRMRHKWRETWQKLSVLNDVWCDAPVNSKSCAFISKNLSRKEIAQERMLVVATVLWFNTDVPQKEGKKIEANEFFLERYLTSS